MLAKRRLLPFVQRLNPRYDAGWVHKDICRRLEKFSDDVAKGLSPRLMILMPPRHGKSELASRMFPAWHLGRHMDHEVIACAYNVSLAMSFSRKVKEAMDDPAYQSVFEARLNPDFRSNEEWGLANGRGGYVAAGGSAQSVGDAPQRQCCSRSFWPAVCREVCNVVTCVTQKTGDVFCAGGVEPPCVE